MKLGTIYIILCLTTGQYYIGSTFKTMKERLYKHIKDYKRHLKNNDKYGICRSSIILKNNNYIIKPIYQYWFKNRKEMEMVEVEEIDYSNPLCVNISKPFVDINKRKKTIEEQQESLAPINCPNCNSITSKCHIARHKRSNYCKNYNSCDG